MHKNPSHIMEVGTGFWASKVLLTAVELDLFTQLGSSALAHRDLASWLGLAGRGAADFFDALVALGFLQREGDTDGVYRNTPETAAFLDKKSPQYMGGILEMLNARLYRFWGDLGEALRTGKPQNEIKQTGKPIFEAIYSDPIRTEQFLGAMAGVQMGSFMALADKFDFSRHGTLCDVGGASGALSIQVARRHPKLRVTTFDLPVVERVAKQAVAAAGLSDRITVASGDFFADPLPRADVIVMGNILHDWGVEAKRALIAKAFGALPPNGVLIAIENIIDSERRKNVFGLLMSLNMLIETEDGFDYTAAQFDDWCRSAGFRSTEVLPLAGPTSAGVAYK